MRNELDSYFRSKRKEMKIVRAIVVFLILASAGCAHVISREALDKVNRDVTFETVLQNPDGYVGKTVLLGGAIIQTQPFPKKTLIMVLQRPLGFNDSLSAESESKGRFILEAPDFLDPAIYRAGRQLTVVGTLVGKEVRALGNMTYTYPFLRSKEIYLWPVERPWNQPRFFFGFGLSHGF